MSGPCSLPNGVNSKYSWDELNEIVCDVHFTCDMRKVDAKGREVKHDFITFREWLFRRRRLTTGKTR